MTAEYHLQYITANEHWPDGSVSVYRISGSQIADREIRAEVIKPERGPAYYSGEVIARHSWCGYIGLFKSLEEAFDAIQKDREGQKALDATQAARKASRKAA